MTEPKQPPRFCQAITRRGEPCKAHAMPSGFCPLHGEKGHEIQLLGSRSKSRQHMLETRMNPRLKSVVDLLGLAIQQVHEGKITPSQGQSIAALGSALIKAVDSAEFATKLEQLEKRLMEASRHAV